MSQKSSVPQADKSVSQALMSDNAVGHISGGHFNCAVTVGLWAGGRFKASDVVPYVIAQVVGAIAAAAVLYVIASGKPDWGWRSGSGWNSVGVVSVLILESPGVGAPERRPRHDERYHEV
jgi:hypothetical protein